MEVPVSIYVLPKEETSRWPAAIVGVNVGEGIMGEQFTWSPDSGTWQNVQGVPAPPDIAEAITEHAKNLGVEW